jgi:hypothetical protein
LSSFLIVVPKNHVSPVYPTIRKNTNSIFATTKRKNCGGDKPIGFGGTECRGGEKIQTSCYVELNITGIM